MRVGFVGITALYWPFAIGNGLRSIEGVDFTCAATLGMSDDIIKEHIGITSTEFANNYGIKLYEDPEEMVVSEKLDTVVLITRHSEHAFWAEKMAKLGMNIYIPKTFATSLSDADRIVQAQRRYGVKIAVGPSARFLPPFVAAKRAIDEGLIGKPFSMRLCHSHGTIDVFKRGDWYRDPKEGGPELSLGWYGIDLVLYFMGGMVKSVSAYYGNFTSPDSPFMDCGRIMMKMESGEIAAFDMYFCNRFPYPSWQLEIAGPKGIISVQRVENDATNTVVSLNSSSGFKFIPVPEKTPHWEMFWVERFKNNEQPDISAEDARTITEISLAALESANKGITVQL